MVARREGVDAHGSSPWAEGPQVKPGESDLNWMGSLSRIDLAETEAWDDPLANGAWDTKIDAGTKGWGQG